MIALVARRPQSIYGSTVAHRSHAPVRYGPDKSQSLTKGYHVRTAGCVDLGTHLG